MYLKKKSPVFLLQKFDPDDRRLSQRRSTLQLSRDENDWEFWESSELIKTHEDGVIVNYLN